MAKVIENGRFTSVAVEHIGPRFNIWCFDRDEREYEVLCNRLGGMSIAFTGAEAAQLQDDLRAVTLGEMTIEQLELKVEETIAPFLRSIGR